jgi:superfamily I DNA/RNA helicase
MSQSRGLNPSQEEAVRSVQGRLLVLAGAGSGKTRVIIHRIVHLISQAGADPRSILGLTFTNKAAEEMRTRLGEMVGKEIAKQVTLSTYHSFCMQVLRREIHRLGYTKEFSLYDEKDIKRLIQQIARDILKIEGELPSLLPTLTSIQSAKSKGFSENEIETEGIWHDSFSKDLFVRLKNCMRAYNAVDFDSLITLTLELFTNHPDVLEKYQERFRYLLIDEYQDTNPAQFKLAEMLTAKYNNLCVVGDDDQSIYGWRGSDVKNILHFKADKTIKLEQNYRSTPTILDAANSVIANNQNRHKKNLWSSNHRGDPIQVFNAPTDAEEARAVVERILYYHQEKGVPLNEIAVLYRSNALSRQIELALMQASFQHNGEWVRGLPYEVYGGLEFTERSEIKDLSCYLRAIANPFDQEALLRIINVPRRGISDNTLDVLTTYNRQKNLSLWSLLEKVAKGEETLDIPAKAKGSIGNFLSLMETAKKRFEKGPLQDALLWFLQETNYRKAIEEDVKSDKMQAFKWENVQEFANGLSQYENDLTSTGRKEELSLQDFVSTTLLDTQKNFSSANNHKGKVQLMTFHSSKGLEFEVCFLIGLEDLIVPHEKGMKETGLEEERRLLYVAMTRAKKQLTLSMARARQRMGKAMPTTPSRFLFEIPKELIKVTSFDAKEW